MRTFMCGVMLSGLLAAGGVVAAAEPESSSLKLDIASQPIGDALNAFAQQSGLQVVMDPKEGAGIVAPRVIGTYTPDAALTKLLENSGLQYKYLNDRTIAVRAVRAEPAASSSVAVPIEGTERRLVLAQAENAVDEKGKDSAEPQALTLEEVVVTGTHIRGAAPAGSAVKVYSREDLDRSGAATLDQFARQMVENLANTDVVSNPHSSVGRAQLSQTARNVFSGAGFNLRGVGPTATLTLLNGHRLASAGDDGSFTDITQIPMSAIDRVEVMADGASALYGSDAIAGVVNIITRKNFSGAETGLRYNSASGGGAIDRTASQLLGGAWQSGNALLSYEYNEQSGLDASQRDYIPPQGGEYALIPPSHRNSALASVRQDIWGGITASADLLYSSRAFRSESVFTSDFFSNATSETGDARQRGAALALDRDLRGDWHLNLTGNYSKIEQTFDSLVTSGPAVLQTTRDLADSSISGVDVLATGPLGTAKMAFGVAYRTEKFFNGAHVLEFPLADVDITDRRHVGSIYGEALVPLGERLDLSIAARYDDYSDFGSALNPKIGLSFEALPGLVLRGTYGESFKAPLLSRLSLISPPITTFVFSGPTFAEVILVQGGNSELDAENSASFTAGIGWSPPQLSGLNLNLTYFHIKFDDRIAQPPLSGASYDLADPLIAPFITPATPELVASYFDDDGFTDLVGAGPDAVEAILDIRYVNIATVKESGIDLSADYDIPLRAGRLNLSLAATRLLDNDYQTVPGGPFVTLVNRFGQPPKLRGRGSIGWSMGGFAASLSINQVNRYDNNISTLAQSIDSWTTTDLHLSYRTPDAGSLSILGGITMAVTVNNLADSRPPRVELPPLVDGQNPLPFDPVNASPVGRLIGLSLSKIW